MKIKEIHGGIFALAGGRCSCKGKKQTQNSTKREGKRHFFHLKPIHKDLFDGINDWMWIFSERRVVFWPETGR